MEWTGNVSTIADVNATATNITMNGSYNITANFVHSILLAANLEAEHVIAASLECYADWGEWPATTCSTVGNATFFDYIRLQTHPDITLNACYHFDTNGFVDAVGDPDGCYECGGTTSSGWPGIHWENPTGVGHGQWVMDY
jgi:hypothetical protein